MRVAIITLGCDKNTVDSEYIAGLLAEAGHEVFIPNESDDFDVLIVNTCGFIESAREESVRAVLEWAHIKKRRPFRLYVVGCLAGRYPKEMKESFPEVDGFAGVGKWREIVKMIEKGSVNKALSDKRPQIKLISPMPRKKLDSLPYAFLKIADGCSHRCSFCAIPNIKGPYRSVPRDILLAEAQSLLKGGVRELNLVAQDSNNYGTDLRPRDSLDGLLKDLLSIKRKLWVRLLYLYPRPLPPALISLKKKKKKLCPYLDIPLQHLSPDVLKRMGRPSDNRRTISMLNHWRNKIPGLTIRTTFIIGFPGETRQDVEYLLKGARDFKFERLGAFLYSPEEGTPAYKLGKPVPKSTARRRLDKLMRLQAEISLEKNQAKLGAKMEVLVEAAIPQKNIYIARSQADAPEVDGAVIISSSAPLHAGDFVNVQITQADEYDLSAKAL